MSKKVKIIILLSILIILFLLMSVYFLLKKHNKFIEPSKFIGETEEIKKENVIFNEVISIKEKYKSIKEKKDQNIKIDNEIYELVKIQKNLDYCRYFNNPNSMDLCYKNIAQENLDRQSCGKIINSNIKKDCERNIDFTLAVNNKDLFFCSDLSDSIGARNCMLKVIKETDVQPVDCDQISLSIPDDFEHRHDIELRDECKAALLLKLAKQNQDVGLCDSIPLYYKKALCFGFFENVSIGSDTDNDGLSFADEYRHKTDPNNPDTDNDGYNDGDEVIKGYNPNGKGALYLY